MKKSGISALVLAAGSSKRMGSPKQLLRLGGKTLLERVLDNLRGSNVDEIVLVLGFAAEEIQREISTEGLVVVFNPAFQQGMGTSLRTALSAIHPQAKGALVILADQPYVRAQTLNSLIDYHQAHGPQITIPLYRGFRGNPVLLDHSVLPELKNLQGDVGCRAIFGSHTENIHKVPLDDPGILLDADTMEDYHRLETMLEAGIGTEVFYGFPAKAEMQAWARSRPDSQPEIVIVGNDPVAAALVRLARILRYTTVVVDPFLTQEEFQEAAQILHCLDFSRLPKHDHRYFVIASRGQFDEEALEQALATDAGYIALMAGKGRREELMRVMKTKGVAEERLNQVHAPAGLEIGAESPEEIALSILAEIVRQHHSG